MLMRPSEYLKSKGWKPDAPKQSPRNALWIDPVTKQAHEFIQALIVQNKRDEK